MLLEISLNTMDFSHIESSSPTQNPSNNDPILNGSIENKKEMELKYFSAINKIGVIADIQYSDKDDGPNFNGTEFRRYRESLNVTKRASKSFLKEEVGAIIQLGDAIDGHSKDNFTKDFKEKLSPILDIAPPNGINPEFLPSRVPRLDVMGNHELYCCSRNHLSSILNDYDHDNDMLSYSREIAGGKWRLIVLDSYAISVLGYNEAELTEYTSKKFNFAKSILEQNNTSSLNHTSTIQIPPKEKQRYDSFNGGLGQVQLKWLEKQLDDAWDKRQFVAIFSHIPISGRHGTEYLWNSLHWDADDILELIKRKGSHVVACVGGHRHSFSHHCQDENDTFTHHLVIPSPLLAPVDGEAHAVLEFSVEEEPVITKGLTDVEPGACSNSTSMGIMRVRGFGTMPKLLNLAKHLPKEWETNLQ